MPGTSFISTTYMIQICWQCVSTLGAGNYSRRASADIKEDLMQEFCWAMDADALHGPPFASCSDSGRRT